MARARIFKPCKTAMQSGTARTRKWVLEYEPASRRDPDPLMGWYSARDTLNEISVTFDTFEEAVAFADKHGIEYSVIEPKTRAQKPKSYADNFRYNRIRI
ncbi:MAG: ETC complex I subunit [Alphaproteobacteria bacterium]|nr:ETC complex I subunit [Alphaproteobacteria bacterium]MBV9858776.1 ETC complex I subunit [Alphaproteobacteria bacterium]